MKSAIKEKGGKWEVFYNTNQSATSWDPSDFEYEDDDEDDDTEFMNDLKAGYRKEDEGYTRFLSVDNETQVANVVKVFGDSPEFKEAYDKYLETRHWNPNPYSHFSFGDTAGRQRYSWSSEI